MSQIINKCQIYLALCLTLLFFFSQRTYGAARVWTGLSSTNWATAGNWLLGGIPSAGDDVTIPATTGAASIITNVPNITLNSLVITGTGQRWLQAGSSGNVITLTSIWTVPVGSTLTIGASSARLVWTLGASCIGTLDGYVAFDAGNTNRNFTVNGTLIINSTGMLFDPNPTGGSDFYLVSGATLKTQKSQGLTLTSAANVAGLNFNVAICFGGSYSYATGANYEFNGADGQITGAGLSQNIPGNVTINVGSGNDLILTSATTIRDNLIMTSGNVDLNGAILTLGNAVATPGTLNRTNGVLYNGTFGRWFNTGNIGIANNAGLFPMGSSTGDYRPLWLGYSTALTTAGVLRVNHTATYPSSYIVASHNDASWVNTLQGVSNSLWTITTVGIAFNGATAMLRYGGTGFGTNTLTDLNASLAASVLGTHGAATNAATTYEVNRTALTTANVANAWRIGTKNKTVSPLPVSLIDLKAAFVDDHVNIDWSTATEKECDHFEIERSADGISFLFLQTVSCYGTSSTRHDYHLEDVSPLQTTNYYRLKQVDGAGSADQAQNLWGKTFFKQTISLV